MRLVVRTWNVFHGNADPPRRTGYLRRMIELVTADGPDVVCLQELPVWALPRLDDWSGMRRFDAVTRPPLWPGPLSKWVTRSHQGFFRSGLSGQANAILVAPRHATTDLGHLRISEHGRERRIVHAVRIAGGTGITVAQPARVERPRAPGGAPRPRSPGRRRSPSGPQPGATWSCSPGTSTSATRGSRGYSSPADGIDHVLVRGARVGPVAAWPRGPAAAQWRRALRPPHRRGVRRDGAGVTFEEARAALPGPRDGRVPERRDVRPARRDLSRMRSSAPSRATPAWAGAATRTSRRRLRSAPRCGGPFAALVGGRARAGCAHELDDRGLRDRAPRARPRARRTRS